MNCRLSSQEILQKLHENGLCVIPDFFSQEEIKNLTESYERIIDTEELQSDYSIGRASILRGKSLAESKESSRELFRKNFFHSLASDYFHTPSVRLEEIYFVEDVVGTKHIANSLHFDIKKTLKYFIYLNDVTKENGAFTCVPGSHVWTQKLRKKNAKNISYENRGISRDLPKLGDEIPIEGKGGTLIIFDTDVFHRAGYVESGKRQVIRSHFRVASSSNNLDSLAKKLWRKLSRLFRA